MLGSDGIRAIKGIGEKTASLYAKLGIYTVSDLINYYPRDYEEYGKVEPIGAKQEGRIFTFQGFVYAVPVTKNLNGKKILIVNIKDETGSIQLNWFNMPYLYSKVKYGNMIIVRGKVSRSASRLMMSQPELMTQEEYIQRLGKIFPIYSLTKGISNNAIRRAAEYAVNETKEVTDWYPSDFKKKYELINISQALKKVHFPKDRKEMIEARKRLVFDEFFAFSLGIRALKGDSSKRRTYFTFNRDTEYKKMLAGLKFDLTNAQKRALADVVNDMRKPVAMNRLVQGDVGCGKTVVAALALRFCVENGYQGALMVPTQVLAVQHFKSLSAMFEGSKVKLELLTSKTPAAKKREIKKALKEGGIDIIIGTHALLSDNVEFRDAALVITDEQHRFGVHQREKMMFKGSSPHVLVLSATPIPRTLALILYGDLDISVIDELPADRIPVKNAVVDESYRPKAYAFIKEQIRQGRQAMIICPMVEPNEELDIENVTEYAGKLKKVYKDEIRSEILHGKMKADKKDDIMDRFANGQIDLLISTTVIEVGINVPNATVMMIENSERFGLSQLHQLRGRVGRGIYQSYCIFMIGHNSKKAQERLEILAKSNDGFEISSKDLKLRGPGELFGIAQSGETSFEIADPYADAATLKQAAEAAAGLSQEEYEKMMKYPAFNEKIVKIAGNVVL